VERVVHLGFEVRVELTLPDGEHFSVQLTRDELEQLELAEGQIVFVRPRSKRVFSQDGRGTQITSEAVTP
jgi:sulfate transport system ATP-binding protein